MTDFFPLGASYYPPHHAEQDWARDLANMAKAGDEVLPGFSVRVAQLFEE